MERQTKVFPCGEKLPVGIEDFEKNRTGNFYYIDKSGFIRELLNNWGEVNLFIRPRHFGKTLNMDMLKKFFEIGTEKALFEGFCISEEGSGRLTEFDKKPLRALCGDEISPRKQRSSLKLLSGMLYKHFGKKVIILLDEYDVPLNKAYENGYYDKMAEWNS